MKHSVIGPSKAHRWVNCPGSVQASIGTPDTYSHAASEGTAAHQLGELTIRKGLWSPRLWDYPTPLEGKENMLHSVDEDMLAAVEVYTKYVFDNTQEDETPLVETRFGLQHIHEDLFGTNDCMFIRPMRELHVIDYKHGQGVYVSIVTGEYDEVIKGNESTIFHPDISEVNPQLLIYALGGMSSIVDPVVDIRLTIVQPRCEAECPIRSVVLSADVVRAWGEELKSKALRCFDKNPEFKMGWWCKFCPVITCPLKVEEAFAVANCKDKPFPLPSELTAKELARINTFAQQFKTWADEVKVFMKHQLETGKMTSKELGFKLVNGRKSKVWKENYEKLILADGLLEKSDLFNEPKAKSPAQVDKLLKEEYGFSTQEREDFLKPAYDEQQGSPSLVSVNDKRPELETSAAIAFKQFDNNKENN